MISWPCPQPAVGFINSIGEENTTTFLSGRLTDRGLKSGGRVRSLPQGEGRGETRNLDGYIRDPISRDFFTSSPSHQSSLYLLHYEQSRSLCFAPLTTLSPTSHPPQSLSCPIHHICSSRTNLQTQNFNMCSVYFIKYDCGCVVQEGDVVYCARRGTTCCSVRRQVRRREGYNCPSHGG
ncbi:hypothetical protein ASPZODRAFT_489831 [Penicilliopsis zonata CBS 506.65]|uniref:Uncharacterized protein n=1 Tax=Penicilliopsis zonata CBS 506.65 TaxID=1073090 RepID=A0A1L9SEF1_9EURO|nr:hypothetical protein ASPZODRAFT_489831 [Penicilliopsis zonata CBS 506.65]OJJ45605.1 hypothetical protein ASPZODRAFT_489831 [Penicilliopsis zonata CBS 506.65]